MHRDLKHFPLPTADLTPEVVILANGSFPTHPLPLALLKRAKRVVCCDGAANEYVDHGFTPEFIVGDGDSLAPELKTRFAHIIHYFPDQETNDLTKAVKFCISQQMKDIVIVGATGKREDHTIGNVSLLIDYMDITDRVQLITDYGVFTPTKSDSTFESFPGQAVSVFCLSPVPVHGCGLTYPLSMFTNWWQGTLNKAYTNPFTILAKGKILIYRAF